MLRLIAFVVVLSCACASSVSAQIVYEPVTVQHRIGNDVVYYAGTDWNVLALIERQILCEEFSHPGLKLFSGGDVAFGGERFSSAPLILDDCRPYTTLNGYGLTVDDVQNAANAQVPLYFRKRDLLERAEVQPDGSLVVPAIPRPRPVHADVPIMIYAKPATRPTTQPATKEFILIMPIRKPVLQGPIASAE